MNYGYSKSLKFVSILLIIAMLMTSQAFTILAAEAVEAIDEVRTTPESAAQAEMGEEVPEIEFTAELAALLHRLQEYATFTEEEKRQIRILFGMEGKPSDSSAAQEAEEKRQDAVETLSGIAQYETKILMMQQQDKVYSTLAEDEKALILTYLEMTEKEADSHFRTLEKKEFSLFESVLIVKITAGGLFTLKEALQLYEMYPERPPRDANVDTFKRFAATFGAEETKETTKKEKTDKKSKAEKEVEKKKADIRKKKTKYTDKAALKAAKAMLLAGYGAAEIKAAYAVAATYDLEPDKVLTKKGQAALDTEKNAENSFFNLFPINRSAFKEKVKEKKVKHTDLAPAAATEASFDYALATKEVMTTSAALYSTTDEPPVSLAAPNVGVGVQQPFNASITDREQISINTGALRYGETLVSLPGINGTDMVLTLTYDSSESNLQDFDYTYHYDTIYSCSATMQVYVDVYGEGLVLYSQTPIYENGFTSLEAAEEYAYALTEPYEITLPEPYTYSVEITYPQTYSKYRIYVAETGETIDEGDDRPDDVIVIDNYGYTAVLTVSYEGETDETYLSTVEVDENGNHIMMETIVCDIVYSGEVTYEKDYGMVYYTDIGYGSEEMLVYADSTALATYNEERYDLGAGWSFNIPSIDYADEDSGDYDRVILPGVGSFAFFENTFEEYAREDMTLTDDDTYTAGQFPSHKKLTFADGTVYYFSEDGLLLAALDRFGNTIQYRYAEIDGSYLLSEIIDTAGRSTTITYADTADGRTVTVTAPDDSETVLHIQNVASEEIDDEGINRILESIVLPDGETITFTYDTEVGSYSYVGEFANPLDFALLTAVTYDTGMELRYTYEETYTPLGDLGSMQFYKVKERCAVADGDEITAEHLAYSYEGSANDCAYEEAYENLDYTYSTAITEQTATGKKETVYVFDIDHRCIEQTTTVNGDAYQKTTTEYDDYDLPSKVTTETYGTDTITVTELYTHDAYGNTLTYISPKGEGDTANTAYRTTYTYDERYQLPLTVEYKQSASTTVRMENTLDSDGKSILSTVTKVNGTTAAKTDYTYDGQGRVLTETAYPDVDIDSGILKRYTYVGADLASETIEDVTGNDGVTVDLTVSYTYDTMGRPLTVTDANGNTTVTTYDARGRVTTVTSPDGGITAYTYNRFENRTSVASSGREPVVYNYDALGQLESVVYASGDLTTESFYDANGNLVAETTNRASTASGTAYYTYDPLGRVTEKTIYDDENKLLYRETYAYDDAVDASTALVTKTVHGDEHAANIVTKTYTNKHGEVVKEDVGGIVTQYAYDYVGNPVRVYYGSTTLARYTYDYAGNMLTETNPAGYTRSITYDDLGRKLTESDFKGNVTSYTYDNAGRLLTMTAPLTEDKNSVTKYYYDENSNIVKQEQSAEAEDSIDPVWRTVEQTYDSMNRVTDIISHVSATVKQYTHYGYNLAGDLTDVYTGMTVPFAMANADSYSHIAYTYDRRGNNTAITDALDQTETYAYDVLGMMLTDRQRDDVELRYTYNAVGNVVTDWAMHPTDAGMESGEPMSVKTYAYTLTGAVRSVTMDGQTVSYTYDGMGNILTETEGNTVKSYTYDSRGRKSGYTLTIAGETISTATYAYDTSNRLTSVTEGGKTTTYTYDQNGNRASQTTDGVTTTYTYNKANLVTGMTNKMGETVISSYVYTYYADGNMHTKAETQLAETTNTTYVYDGAGRLTSETIGDKVISYYYDANGNRTLMNNDGVITSYTYDKNNRLLTEGDITYTYDANGNTLTAGDKEYTYNYRGQQVEYSDGTTTASYAYNPSGLRSAKTVGGSTKYFVYNGMQIVFEYEDSVSDGTTYYYGLNRTHSSDGNVYVYNAHGDTVQLVNGGSLSASYTYDAFGNLLNSVGNSDNPFLYCSEYFDQETQTYYLRARYYNPANGRFTQQDAWAFMDPADPLTLNLYTYCANNPVMYVDPSGNAWYHWALGAVIVAACAVAVVATAGGAAAGIAAVASVASGTAAATAASTVAAGAFIGSATVYGTAALYAAGNSSLESPEAFIEDFNAQGNWGTVVGTGLGGLYGAVYGYAVYRDAANQNSNDMPSELPQPSNTSQTQSMDPYKIRFSQDSIKNEFSDGTSLQTTIDGLRSGTIKPSDITPIRIFEKDGLLYTLDNRRLYVAQQAGVNVNYVWATETEIQNEMWKFTTTNNGISIRVRS